jgi:hypothetical protein
MPGTKREASTRVALQRIVYAVALVLSALLLGTSFAHVLEIRAKAAMAGDLWTTLQQRLYLAFGSVGGAVEMGTIASTVALAMTLRHVRGFALATAAAFCFAAGFFVVFLALVEPVNRRVRAWAPAHVPGDWEHWRRQWDTGHGLRFSLHLVGFVLLVLLRL